MRLVTSSASSTGPLRNPRSKPESTRLPLYDPSGRLFVASENPVPYNQEFGFKQKEIDLKYGILTINEIRQDTGLPPVPWGETPWLNVNLAPTDFPQRTEHAPNTGRAKVNHPDTEDTEERKEEP